MSTKSHGHHHPNHNGDVGVAERASQSHPSTGHVAHDQERYRLTEIAAYSLWEQAGKPAGEEAKERFWCEAEATIVAAETHKG